MREYMRPTMQGEVFAANEYVAVCWRVGCKNNTSWHNKYTNAPDISGWGGVAEGPYDYPFSHDGDCRNPSNNYFRGDPNGDNIEFVMETTSGDLGNLSGGFCTWTDANSNGIVDTDDVIYWYTAANDGRRWNHWGRVQSTDLTHPNRS